MNAAHLRILTAPDEDGSISDADLVVEINAGASRIRTFLQSISALQDVENPKYEEHVDHLTTLAEGEAERIRRLANVWLDQKKEAVGKA